MPNKGRQKPIPISTDTGDTTRTRVIKTAQRRNYDVVFSRMLAYTDLFAYDAKYHRSCYSHYTSERNIQAVAAKAAALDMLIHDRAFDKICIHIEQNVLSKHNHQVVTLADERTHFIKVLVELGMDKSDAERYSSWKLKQRLQSHFKGKLSYYQRLGHSDFMCSSDIAIGKALAKVYVL